MTALLTDVPAILGGTPIWNEFIPPPVPNFAVLFQQLAESKHWAQYHGNYLPELQQCLQQQFHVPHVATCASGTLAMETALRAAQVQPGDEVILSAYEYEPNFLTVHQLQAIPVLAEVNAQAQMDLQTVSDLISPKTKAIICTHLHGGIVDIPKIKSICTARGITVIEDVAQAPGGYLQHQQLGTFGDLAILSFGGSKLLSAGRGGAILSTSDTHFRRVQSYLKRGVQHWAEISELQAAVLIPQIQPLKQTTQQRFLLVLQLVEKLKEIPGIRWLHPQQEGTMPAFYKLGLWLEPESFGLSRPHFLQAIQAEGIPFAEGFRCLVTGRSPKRYVQRMSLQNALRAGEQLVKLHHSILQFEQTAVDAVANAILRTYRNRQRIHTELEASAP